MLWSNLTWCSARAEPTERRFLAHGQCDESSSTTVATAAGFDHIFGYAQKFCGAGENERKCDGYVKGAIGSASTLAMMRASEW